MPTAIPPPGYGFFPTDHELVLFYLINKVLGQRLTVVDQVIQEVDLYKFPPWDILGKCSNCAGQEGYFFFRHERKFTSSSRKRRSTDIGQWKTTGKDKNIIYKSRTVGRKKTLVFYARNGSHDENTNWVIHEYSLCDQQLGYSGASKNCFVVCKLFKKNGIGANNDESIALEDWKDEAYSALGPNPSLIGGFRPDKPSCSADTLEEEISSVIDYTGVTFNCSGASGQEMTFHMGASFSHKTNEHHQHNSFSAEEIYKVDAAHMFSHPRIPAAQLYSGFNEDSYDLEKTLLNYSPDEIDGCSGQKGDMIPAVGSLMNFPTHDNNAYPHHQITNTLKATSSIISLTNKINLKMQITTSPGFRFSPNEYELVFFYLKNKVLGQEHTIVDQMIPEVDLYQLSPWDISEKCLKSSGQQGYFFCLHERKFPSSSRKRRSTDSGQWRTTGKDKEITYKSQTVARMRTLVFHVQKPSPTENAKWVIHEYSLCDQQHGDSGASKNDYVLCKLIKKSTFVLKNGESCEMDDDDAYSDATFFPGSSFTGELRSDKSCCSKDKEVVSCVPNNTITTSNCLDMSSQEATSHLESSFPHIMDGNQHSLLARQEHYEIDADIDMTCHLSSCCGRSPVNKFYCECAEGPLDPVFNCLRDDIDGFFSQHESTIPMVSSPMNCSTDDISCCSHHTKCICNHPAGLTPEFESPGSSKITFDGLPAEELLPIDCLCYCSLHVDD